MIRSRVGIASLISALVVPGLTAIASATPAHAACADQGTYYSIKSHTAYNVPYIGVPTFKDGPGGSITVSRIYSGTAKASVTAGAEAEAGVVLAKAKASISITLGMEFTVSTQHSYTRKITKGKYGHVQYVSYGQKLTYTKTVIDAKCATKSYSRWAIFPSTEEGWRYWETSS
jgi:hypothetical protein